MPFNPHRAAQAAVGLIMRRFSGKFARCDWGAVGQGPKPVPVTTRRSEQRTHAIAKSRKTARRGFDAMAAIACLRDCRQRPKSASSQKDRKGPSDAPN